MNRIKLQKHLILHAMETSTQGDIWCACGHELPWHQDLQRTGSVEEWAAHAALAYRSRG